MSNRTELFEETPIPKAVAQLSIPIVIGSLVMILYNLADTFFVGMLNDPIQNAGVTLASPILLAFNAVTNLFGVGASSLMSRSLGVKDFETAKKTSAIAFWSSFVFAAIFSLACTIFKTPLIHMLGSTDATFQATSDYMFWTVTCGAIPAIVNMVMSYMVRSEGNALHASIGSMSGCILNIILDPIFILPWGFNMGAAGAGCATFISNTFAFGYYLVLNYTKRKSTIVCINPKMICFDKRIIGGIFAIGIPACIQNLLNVVGSTILNNKMAGYGSDPVAAMGIVQKINMIPMMISLGVSQGIMPLISYNYASGNIKRMKESFTFTVKIAMIFIGAMVVIYYIGAGGIVNAFMKNEAVVTIGTGLLRGFCLGLPFMVFDFIAVGVFQATGMGKNALMFALARKLALEIPAIFVLDMLFPLYGLAYSQFVAELVLTIIAIGVIRNLFKKLEQRKATN
ncbi:MAG: MATE family efflux transporter [Lachnospiraceae bacterium]|nr:MATE family efflux transporter [Lachnospiraceae bacterium]